MSHLANNSVNGIKIMIYMVLIFMLLMLIYKQSNNLKGYKYVKTKLINELEEEFYRYIVTISGGILITFENEVKMIRKCLIINVMFIQNNTLWV